MDRTRVLIADDESSVREALVELIESDDTMEVVEAVADAQAAIDSARRTHPDIALLDVKMGGGGGSRAAREIRTASPQTRVVAISAYEDRRTVMEMLRAGVVGYVVKGSAPDDIIESIRRSMRGQETLSAEVTADVIHELAGLLERSEAMARDLEELNRVKTELIQILSHELLTPTTIIQGFAGTVKARGPRLTSDEIEEMSEGVTRAGDRIKRLIGNLEAAAGLDHQGVALETAMVSLEEVLSMAMGEFAHDRPRLVLPEPVPDVKLLADRDLAARALSVVIENALGFSKKDELVEVGVRTVAPWVDIIVSDRGPGIDGPARKRIFEPFTQVDTSTTRTHQGLGIGLYLARRIVEAHGGQIAQWTNDRGGSSFSLRFPSVDQDRR